MSVIDEPRIDDVVEETELPPDLPPPPPPGDGDGEEDERPALGDLVRPALAAAFATAALGLVAGGIFGSWPARLTGLVGAFAGAGWAVLAQRSRRPTFVQAIFPPVALFIAAISLIPRGESPAALFRLMGDAIEAGRLFRPPVPFDPGWTPLLLLLTALIAFAAAWVGTAMGRPRLAVAIPLPIVGLTAITQPDDGQFIAGICAFLPILAALAVLFGGDSRRASDLDRSFEAKRAVRSALAAVPVIALLFLFGNASFLFPEPRYDPNEQPQKPKAVPLSASDDRVLFEVDTDSDITGPWRTGVLDVYDPEDAFWKSPPKELEKVPADGVLSDVRAGAEQEQVTITIRDLGNAAAIPMLAGTTRITFAQDPPGSTRLDVRTDLLRVEQGRVPAGLAYTLALPAYPTGDQLLEATVPEGKRFAEQLEISKPPAVVQDILVTAGPSPWEKLDALRTKLLATVSSKGAGSPVEVTAKRVGELFRDNAKASPDEIVAAEAMLARWAGVPSRIGFGFDGLNDEDGVLTVRPRNSAQWLEVYFEGFGWTPLIGSPNQAEATLDSDPNARFTPTVLPSDDVAVELYLAYEVQDFEQLYQRVRRQIVRWAPVLLSLGALWFVWPVGAKAWRRAKRRRWATAIGPRAQIAVEYAELRDLAGDLNVGDIWSTPLEYTFEVKDDVEHTELAWLVTRSLYGDMKDTATDEDVRAAEQLSASVRRRLLRAQPVQSQLLALVTRASIVQPYSTEVPNVRQLKLPRPKLRRPRLRLPRRRRPALGAAR